MSDKHQGELRDELLAITLPYIADKRTSLVEAAVACMGACAVVLGAMPTGMREMVADELCASLLTHADKRAKQIHSGELDRHFDN